MSLQKKIPPKKFTQVSGARPYRVVQGGMDRFWVPLAPPATCPVHRKGFLPPNPARPAQPMAPEPSPAHARFAHFPHPLPSSNLFSDPIPAFWELRIAFARVYFLRCCLSLSYNLCETIWFLRSGRICAIDCTRYARPMQCCAMVFSCDPRELVFLSRSLTQIWRSNC